MALRASSLLPADGIPTSNGLPVPGEHVVSRLQLRLSDATRMNPLLLKGRIYVTNTVKGTSELMIKTYIEYAMSDTSAN